VHVSEDHQVALVDNSQFQPEAFYKENETTTPQEANHDTTKPQPTSLWSSIKNEPHLARKLAGTAGTWFLFDVLFYGNTLFEPVVLEAAFGSKDDVEDGYTLLLIAVRDSLMISLMSLPGYFVTVLLIGRKTCVCTSIRSRSARCSTICPPCNQTPSYIQMQGFILMFLLYLDRYLLDVTIGHPMAFITPLCRHLLLCQLRTKLHHVSYCPASRIRRSVDHSIIHERIQGICAKVTTTTDKKTPNPSPAAPQLHTTQRCRIAKHLLIFMSLRLTSPGRMVRHPICFFFDTCILVLIITTHTA
jgi:hypothetical protein